MKFSTNRKKIKNYLNEVWFLIGKDKQKIPLLFLLFLSMSILDIAGIGIIGPYFGFLLKSSTVQSNSFFKYLPSILSENKINFIFFISSLLICVFLLKTILIISINKYIFKFSHKKAAELRIKLMNSYMYIPYEKYMEKNSSEIIQTVQDFVTQFVEKTLIPLFSLISEGLISIIIILFLFWINWYSLTIMILLIGSVVLIYDRFFRIKMLSEGKKANNEMTIIIKSLKEGLGGLKVVRILGIESYFIDKLRISALKNAKYVSNANTIITAPRYILELTMIFFVVIITILMLKDTGNIESVVSLLAMFGVAAMRLIPSASLLMGGVSRLRIGRHATHILYSDLNKIEAFQKDEKFLKLNLKNSGNHLYNKFQKIELKNVGFRYSNANDDCLKNVSIEIKRGEAVGIIGRSGSGKTTLVDVMLGLLKNTSGEIDFNNNPIEKDIDSWRSCVAYLPQYSFITDATIRENISIGLNIKKVKDEYIWDVLELARLKPFVESLPQGLDTILGEEGTRLSGGQRQRIALARAFFHNRDVIIMDESTSSLDEETELEIVDAIKSLHGKKTIIVIAHKVKILQNCDRVYKIENGYSKIFSSINE